MRDVLSTREGDRYYKVGELVVLLENAHMNFNDYLKRVGDLKLSSFVGKLDFDDLIQYLQGKSTTSEQVRWSSLGLDSRIACACG